MTEDSNKRLEVLKLVLADVERERDRMRDARASFTVRLGPLPASVGVVTGIIAAAAGKVAWQYVAGAGVILAIIVAVSVRFMGLKPYRVLRSEAQPEFDPEWDQQSMRFREGEENVGEWLEQKIRLEAEVYGLPGERNRWWPKWEPKTLVEGLNSERWAANVVHALVVGVFIVLIAGIAIRA